MKHARTLARSILLSAAGRMTARMLAPGTSTIVMLHRFTDATRSERGFHTSRELRTLFASLRRHRIPVRSLADLIAPVNGAPEGGVVFTIDDGFADFSRVAWPVFREFDFPATVFLTTGFLDGKLWPWWEQVLWAFATTRVRRLRIDVPGVRMDRSWATDTERSRLASDLIETLKLLRDDDRVAAVRALAESLAAPLPDRPPDEHAPMSWAEVRSAASEGASFGPHTVSHPILTRVDEARARDEISTSWDRVRAETDAAIPVFCYPNGDAASFGEREVQLVRQLGLSAGVSAMPDNVTRADLAPGGRRRYALPRFACPHDAQTLRWLASGWEHLRAPA